MIAKKTSIKRARGAAALAKYIAAAKEKGEKLDQFWLSNCKAGVGLEDLDTAIAEICATQGMNQRSKADPNYHLVVSFAEGEKPDSDVLKDIEQEFAKALGLEDHQRVVGTHINTENYHMHIQFNLVHPETFRMHVPYGDFKILQKTAAKLEKKHGLAVVQGRGQEKDRENHKARDKEANSWEQSFSGYLQEHKKALLEIREKASTWQEFHDGIDQFGIVIKRRGNGLVFQDRETGIRERASTVDRSFSKKRMEETFGPFQGPDRERPGPHRHETKYKRRPLDPRLERHSAWRRFEQGGGPTPARSWRRFLETQAAVNAEAREALELQRAYFQLLAGKNPHKVSTRQVSPRKSKGMSR